MGFLHLLWNPSKEVEKTHVAPHGFLKAPLRYWKGSSKNLCGASQVFGGFFPVPQIGSKVAEKTCAVPHEFSPPPLKDSKGGAKNPCGTTQVFPTSFNLVFKRYQKKHCNHHFYF